MKLTISRGVNEARAALDEQYDRLFASPRSASSDVRGGRGFRQALEAAFLGLNEPVWRRVPVRARDLRPVRVYGAWLHQLVCRRADREMYLGTFFLRNRPALEMMRRLAQKEAMAPGSNRRVGVQHRRRGVFDSLDARFKPAGPRAGPQRRRHIA